MQLRQALVSAFARCTRVRWASALSCRTLANDLKLFLKEIAVRERPVRRVGQLTPVVWEEWLAPSLGRRRLSSLLLDGLPPETRYAVTMRRLGSGRRAAVKEGYSKETVHQVRDAAARTVRAARLRIEGNARLPEQWRSGGLDAGHAEEGWAQVLDFVIRHGDLPRQPCGRARSWADRVLRERFGSGCVPQGLLALFPSQAEIGAAAVLLVCHEAWNLSVLQEMKVPGQWPNADQDSDTPAIYRVDTDKPRRGTQRRHNSNNLVDAGEHTPGWAMQQVLVMTGPARASAAHLGRPTDLLLVTRRRGPGNGGPKTADGSVYLGDRISSWAAQSRAAGAAVPTDLTARRLRHAVQVFAGARNNTQRVHEDFYLRRDKTVIDTGRDVVAAGLDKAVAAAHEQVRMRFLTGTDAGAVTPRCWPPRPGSRSSGPRRFWPVYWTPRWGRARTSSTVRCPPAAGARCRSCCASPARTRSRPPGICRGSSTCSRLSISCGPLSAPRCGGPTGLPIMPGSVTSSAVTPTPPAGRRCWGRSAHASGT
ncbi:hypothetical protein AB0O05_02690 [Streptomyces sp. NPDC093084]|uniref:hypothetical protein n=1 Tax=Streptomyces sp. NPDC093084 TaxID=3155197 RepID=UPI00344A447D